VRQLLPCVVLCNEALVPLDYKRMLVILLGYQDTKEKERIFEGYPLRGLGLPASL
jgi:hypothetical protein